MKKRFLAFSVATVMSAGLAGCAMFEDQQEFVLGTQPLELCLVDNPDVRAEVFLEIRRALLDKGFTVKRVEYGDLETIKTCHQTIYFDAQFGSSWSQSALRYAKLELIERARHSNIFSVQWDERRSKPTLYDRIEDPAVEIRQLVDRLFPSEIAWK